MVGEDGVKNVGKSSRVPHFPNSMSQTPPKSHSKYDQAQTWLIGT